MIILPPMIHLQQLHVVDSPYGQINWGVISSWRISSTKLSFGPRGNPPTGLQLVPVHQSNLCSRGPWYEERLEIPLGLNNQHEISTQNLHPPCCLIELVPFLHPQLEHQQQRFPLQPTIKNPWPPAKGLPLPNDPSRLPSTKHFADYCPAHSAPLTPSKHPMILLMEEIRRSPVEVGSLAHYFLGLYIPRFLAGFLNHQQYATVKRSNSKISNFFLGHCRSFPPLFGE